MNDKLNITQYIIDMISSTNSILYPFLWGVPPGVIFNVIGNGYGNLNTKSWTKLFAFHTLLISLGKV